MIESGLLEQANAAKRLGDQFVPPVGAHLCIIDRPLLSSVVRCMVIHHKSFELSGKVGFVVQSYIRLGLGGYANVGSPHFVSTDTLFLVLEVPEGCLPFEKWYRPGNG